MQCPLCKKNTMNSTELLPDLKGLTCNECFGVWLDRSKYDAWRAKQPRDLPETSTPAHLAVSETHKAKICPQCGHLLLPYRVGHGLAFSIDYCTACGGVWCERNEWDAIKAKNLHDNLHDIITQHWQAAIRQEEVQESIEQTYSRHLGTSYAKAQEIRTWLHGQSQKALILAYLADRKPEVKAL
jgi:Zn-finger nucleic acid-binding protein